MSRARRDSGGKGCRAGREKRVGRLREREKNYVSLT